MNAKGSKVKWPIFGLISLAGITFLLLALVAYPGYAEGLIRKRWNAKLAKLKDSSRVWRKADFNDRYVWKSADGTHAFRERDGTLWVFDSADADKLPDDFLASVEKDRSKLFNCFYDPTNGTSSPGLGFVLIK